jgi:hypothetical protein
MISKMIFAAYAETIDQLRNIGRLGESIRIFGGRYRKSPIWAYIPEDMKSNDARLLRRLKNLNVEIRCSHPPWEAEAYHYAGKTFAAGKAEAAAEGRTEILVWMDEDTVMLDEPRELALPKGIVFGYRPVMHNRAGSLYDVPPDKFWSRIYKLLEINPELLFPVITQVDRQKIRAYFQAGLLVVRPREGILQQWPADFKRLYEDSLLAENCHKDREKNIFLHQNALVGAVLKRAAKDRMVQLPDSYNYPLFFEQNYDSPDKYNNIENKVTIRLVISPDRLTPGLFNDLNGPADRVSWLMERLLK